MIESLENSMLFLSNLNKSAVLEFSYDYHNLAHNFLYFYFACWKCHPTLCLLNLAFKNPKWKCLLYGSCDICDLFNITICIDNRIPGRGEQIRLFTFLADRAELTLTSPQLWLLLKVTKVIVASAGIRTQDLQGVKHKRYLYAIVPLLVSKRKLKVYKVNVTLGPGS